MLNWLKSVLLNIAVIPELEPMRIVAQRVVEFEFYANRYEMKGNLRW